MENKISGSNISIDANEIIISYNDLGAGRIPIIFIHGFPFDKSTWQPQMDFLKATHRVIAYDIRGFGKSTLGDEKLSISLFADDLIKFMDMLQIPKAIVCGLSMGGYILLNAVHRYPARFAGLVLADTQCAADLPESRLKRKHAIENIEANGLDEFVANFISSALSKSFLETNLEWPKKVESIMKSSSVEAVTQTLNAMAIRWETCSTLGGINVPTLILCGEEDAITPPAKSKYMNAEIANSELKIIESAGHLSNIEQPIQFNNYLHNFISAIVK